MDPKPTRIEAYFQTHGSDKFERLGEIDKISVTETHTFGAHTFTNTYEPGNPDSMEAATNRLAKIAIHPSRSNFKIAAAEEKRRRRQAKRVREREAAKARLPMVTYLDNSNRTKGGGRLEAAGHIGIMVQQGDGSFEVVDAGKPL